MKIERPETPYLSRNGTIRVGYADNEDFIMCEIATNKWWSVSSSWSVILGLYPPD